MTKQADLVILGAGAAGLTAAFTGAGFSKKVILIDQNKPGGECTWSGCIPSKALINRAKEIHHVRKYVPEYKADTAKILQEVRHVMEQVYENESPEVLAKAGIEFIQGKAEFQDAHRLVVNGETIEAKKVIIATGSKPAVPPIEGLKDVPYLTNENLFQQETLPESLLILGGGPIGSEMAQAIARLGTEVHLIEKAPGILSNDEPEHADMIKNRLEDEGVTVYVNTEAKSVKEQEGKIHLTVEKEGTTFEVVADKILVALGRQATLKGFGLENTGIEFDDKKIKVDDHMETTVKGVYAIGDVVGPYQLSHMANAQGITAAQDAILPIRRKIDYANVTWCTYTDPEIGHSGLSEKEARKKHGDSIRVYTHSFDELDRAKTKPENLGSVKLILDKKGDVLGASVIGDRAGEIISQIQTIKMLDINMGKMAGVIHPYPTYSEVLVKLGKKIAVDNLLNKPIIKQVTKWRDKESD